MLYRRREAAPASSAESSSSAEVQEENPAGSAAACLSVVADSAAGGFPVADSALGSSTLVAAESKDNGGRVRVGWAAHAAQQLIGETEPNLRQCAQKWLQEKSILHSTLRNGTDKMCCFRLRQPAPDASDESYFLVVEHKGACTSKKDLLQRKLLLAREYALQHSPARTIKKMKDAGVPAQELPSMGAAENQRPGVKKETDYSTDCLQQLKKFLAEPPDGLCIYHDKVVCEPKEARVPFSVSGTHEVFQDCGLSAFLLEFTYMTNRDAKPSRAKPKNRAKPDAEKKKKVAKPRRAKPSRAKPDEEENPSQARRNSPSPTEPSQTKKKIEPSQTKRLKKPSALPKPHRAKPDEEKKPSHARR